MTQSGEMAIWDRNIRGEYLKLCDSGRRDWSYTAINKGLPRIPDNTRS